MPYPVAAADSAGWITGEPMLEVDRVMIEDLDIMLVHMTENAGRNLARVAIDLFSARRVRVAAASGGNDGGGLVAAGHLANAGVEVRDTVTRPAMIDRMRIPVTHDDAITDTEHADVAIDAVIGRLGNAEATLALDAPSGLDVTTGSKRCAVVDADATLPVALPKTGLRDRPCVGRRLLADISVPATVTGPLDGAPDFRLSPIVELVEGPHG